MYPSECVVHNRTWSIEGEDEDGLPQTLERLIIPSPIILHSQDSLIQDMLVILAGKYPA